MPKDKIETLGMGKTQPVPGVVCKQKNMKELIACLAPNRRVEVEVKGEGRHEANAAKLRKKPRRRAGLFFGGVRSDIARAAYHQSDRDSRASFA